MTEQTEQNMPPQESSKHAQLRAMVRGAYDLQRLRVQTGLRLCAAFRVKLGQTAKLTEEELEKEAQDILTLLRASFVRLTDGVARNRTLPTREGFSGDELISEYTELVLVSHYLQLDQAEKQQFRNLSPVLEDFPIYSKFLSNITGIGPAMAGVIISEIPIANITYVSSLWRYAGLDVGPMLPNGRSGRTRQRPHMIQRQYINSDGKEDWHNSITYNPMLKSKLMGVLGPSFLKTGSDFRRFYDMKKAEYSARGPDWINPQTKEKDPSWSDGKTGPNKARCHQAAMRFMVKEFLRQLYEAWRPLEGFPVTADYRTAKLGLVREHHHGAAHMQDHALNLARRLFGRDYVGTGRNVAVHPTGGYFVYVPTGTVLKNVPKEWRDLPVTVMEFVPRPAPRPATAKGTEATGSD